MSHDRNKRLTRVTKIYIPFYSRSGELEMMAQAVAEGVESQDAQAVLAFTGNLLENAEEIAADRRWKMVDDRLRKHYPKADVEELADADGAVFGSPALFGTMAAEMKAFVDRAYKVWRQGRMQNKPAGTFTSSQTLHGGQELGNYTMWVTLAHLGYLIIGVPYSAVDLQLTQSGGTPYGPSHVSALKTPRIPDKLELRICRILGARVAALARLTRPMHECDIYCDRVNLPRSEDPRSGATITWDTLHAGTTAGTET